MKKGLRSPPSSFGPSNNSGYQGSPFQPFNITSKSLETVLMVKWMRDTFEFDQPYKQSESKMQVTGKISSNKEDYACVTVKSFKHVNQCK